MSDDRELFERGGDLLDDVDAGRFHRSASDACDGVVMDTSLLSDRSPGAVSFVGVERLEHVIEFHDAHYADLLSRVNAHLHKPGGSHAWHHQEMKEKVTKKRHLQINLEGLFESAKVTDPKLTLNGWSVLYQLDQSLMHRIIKKGREPGSRVLDEIAAAFGLAGWQLIAPDLGAHLYQYNEHRQIVPVFDPGKLKRPQKPVKDMATLDAEVRTARGRTARERHKAR